jgi:hypothetical protein
MDRIKYSNNKILLSYISIYILTIIIIYLNGSNYDIENSEFLMIVLKKKTNIILYFKH